MDASADADSRPGTGVQATLDALSSPIRREILWMVWDRELAAGDIAAAFELTAPTISTHLGALRRAGLVTMRVDGNFRRYRARPESVRALLPFLATDDRRWQEADAIPERALASVSVQQLVVVAVDVALAQSAAFDAFTDRHEFSRWLGVPVTIRDGRFACTLEWGTRVRGMYEVVAPPQLIALRWDFDDDAVPVPGRELVGYVRFSAVPGGCHVEVHQHAADTHQATFLTAAWSMVLGRLKQSTEQPTALRPRSRRPKIIGPD
jgi:DNA-binding transcriptional ArsR family regulator/uncharacterized protein YndB with AHSA1/START domain